MSYFCRMKPIKRALISTYNKDDLENIILTLRDLGVEIYATGGTFDFITALHVPVMAVENLTGYPSILGGRVKTLHPKIFGGILVRRDQANDVEELSTYAIPPFDLVIVDLYPFNEAVASGATEEEVIEKIDIGGISLIRAAAKNYHDVLVISGKQQYPELLHILTTNKGSTDLTQRKRFATQAFQTSAHYDTAIYHFFSQHRSHPLRYGENPHQTGQYVGTPDSLPKQIHGKELSYNNLLDLESAIELINDFTQPTVAIIKHNNACGCASDQILLKAWERALAADPLSAFGGIIITNRPVEADVAQAMHSLFFEILAAPAYSIEALEILTTKKNAIILELSPMQLPKEKCRTLLNGVLVQERDAAGEKAYNLAPCTLQNPDPAQIDDLCFANKLVKHAKSNAIVLAKNETLLASGVGQTSRIDALRYAIEKAQRFGHSLQGAVMASDAFFPFPDCVEMAHKAGITAIIQPGGSVRDQESVDYCNMNQISMICTGIRHFKH